MLVYKVLTLAQAAEYERAGEVPLSGDDARDGYVHLSTRAQLLGTLERHFAAEPAIRVLAVEADRLGDALRWEKSRKGEDFPHLYGRLQAQDAAMSWEIARSHDGSFSMPADMPA